MTRLLTAAFLGGALFLAACSQPGAYPVSGEQCGPTDLVAALDAAECQVPGT